MSVALIAVVAVLLADHVVPALAALRRFDWLVAWRRYLEAASAPDGALTGRLGLVLPVGLPVLLVALLQVGLRDRLWGLPGFVFATAMLFWCWGPRDLDGDVGAIVDAGAETERKAALANLVHDGGEASVDGPRLVAAVFECALRRWFSPLFWFALLGPAAVLAYRVLEQLGIDPAHAGATPRQRADARWLTSVLDWPVAQLMALALALAANFDAVFAAWKEWHADGMRLDAGFLAAAACASVDTEMAADDTDLPEADVIAGVPSLLALRDAMSLVWRVLLLWLAVLAIFVIARLF